MGVLCDFMAYYHLIHERRGLATTSRSNFLTHEHYVCWRIIGFSMVLLNGQLWNIVSTNPEFLHTFTFSPSYLPLPMYLPADGRPTPRFPAISVNVSREYVSLRDAGWMDRTHLKAQREVNWLSSTSPLTIKLLPPSRTYLLMRWRVIWHPGRWTRPAEVPRLSSAVAVCRRCDQLYRRGSDDMEHMTMERWWWFTRNGSDKACVLRTAIHHHLCYGAIFGACRA